MKRPSSDDLLKHAGFLRALAFRLMGDDARADDLVQEAYVAALERPPRGALRAWLGAVVRNLAGKARRSEGRRRERERLASRKEPLKGADDVAARIALHKSLVGAVESLEEPYRSTIVLRFFYDLKPHEVAGRLGVPVETVRTRTRRALDLLRGRLDRNALFLALLPLPALKNASALTWGVLMATKRHLVFVLLLLALLGGGTLVLMGRGRGEIARAPDRAAIAGGPGGATPGDPEPLTFAPGRTGADEETKVTLKGLVLLDGVPVAGAEVALRDVPPRPPLFDWQTQLHRRMTAPLPKALDETRTDAQGRFAVRSPYRAAFTIEAIAPGAIPGEVLAYVPIAEDLTIRLKRGAEIAGRVVDEAGAPVPDALVRWRSYAGARIGGETVTDAEGGFRVPGGRVWIVVLAKGYAPANADAAQAARIVLGRGGLVTGVITDGAGATVSDATVLLLTTAPAETRTDASGRYELRLPEGHLQHAMVHAPARLPLSSWADEIALPPKPVALGGELAFDIVLPPAARLSGTVVEGSSPVAGADVTLYRAGVRMPFAIAEAATDARGGFVFDAVGAGAYEVHAAARALRGRADVQVVDGAAPPAVTVALERVGRIEGVVTGGIAVERVYLEAGGDARVDALGRFVFEQVAPTEATRVCANPKSIRTEPFAVRAGETARVTLDTSVARMLGGRVVDARGAPVTGALVAAFEKRSHSGAWFDLSVLRDVAVTTGADGRFAVPVPDECLVWAYHPDAAPARILSVDPDADLEITLQPGRVVIGRVVWPGGTPARDVELRCTGADGAPDVAADTSWRRVPSGEFELRALGTGHVYIAARHPDGVAEPVVVETGTRDLVIELRRARTIRGAVVDGAGRPVSSARVTARAAGRKDAVAHSSHQGRFEIRGLEDGTYDLHLEPGTQSDWHPPRLMPFVPIVVPGVAAGTGDVVVEVDRGEGASGSVVRPDGKPVAGAFVAALGRRGQLAPTARTRMDGRFALTGITAEHREILVVAEGFPPRAVPIGDAMEIRLPAGEPLRLRVLAPDGTPVAGQWVSATAATPAIADRAKDWLDRLGRAAEGAGWISGGSAQTDAKGRAEIPGLFPGEYRISSIRTAAGIAPGFNGRTGGPEQAVRLEPAHSIAGKVVDAAGNPVGSVKGERWINVSAHRGDDHLGTVVVGEDGSFEIGGLLAGPIRLSVGYTGPAPAFAGETTAQAGARDVRIVATR